MTDSITTERQDDPGSRGRRRSGGVRGFLRDLLIIFLIAIVASFLIKTFLVRSFYIPSASMENTLQINDRILVNELVPNVVGVERGDVVVFKDPGGWLPPSTQTSVNPIDWFLTVIGLSAADSNDHLIKRVIGLPGDHVVCCNGLGQMTVNGVPLDESQYVVLPAGETKVSKDPFDITVPKGSLWVMGDNRYNSSDSRYNQGKPGGGFVPIENVVGRAFVITWPVQHWNWLSDYPDVFAGVDPEQQ